VPGRRNFLTSFWPVMMGLVEATLQPKGHPSRYYNLATISPLSTKMQEYMPANVTGAKEWGSLLPWMNIRGILRSKMGLLRKS